MSTVGALIEETRGHLYGFHKTQLNRLRDPIDAVVTGLTVEFGADPIPRHAVLCIGNELMYVWAVSGAALTVQRGHFGTPIGPHPAGSLIEINPRFSTPTIRAELAKEIRSWEPRIFAVVEETIDIGMNARTVDLEGAPSNFLHVLRVRRSATGAELTPRGMDFRVERDYGAYPSGTALILTETVPAAATLSVLYAIPFELDGFTDDVDLVADVGLPVSCLDIPPVGAAWRLLSTREVSRTTIESAPEPRVAQDVPAGHIIQAARQLKALRDERIGEEGRLVLWRHGVRRQ